MEKKETLTAEETKQILDKFYVECLNFWKRETDRDNKIKKDDVEQLALRDVKCIKRDPTVPLGRYLDVTAKEEWVQEKEKQLSEKNNVMELEKEEHKKEEGEFTLSRFNKRSRQRKGKLYQMER